MQSTPNLDSRDQRLLELLSRDAWMTLSALGEAVSLSPSAVQRRIKVLREMGALTGARAIVPRELLGKSLRIFVLVELNDERPATLRAIERAIEQWPDIEAAEFVTGAYDMILSISTTGMTEYSHFLENVLASNQHVRRVRTLTVLRSAFSAPKVRQRR